MSKKLDLEEDWFDALRTLAVGLSSQNCFLVTSAGTTTDEFVRRIGQLFGIPILELIPFPKQPDQAWLESTQQKIGELAHRSSGLPTKITSPQTYPVYYKSVAEPGNQTNDFKIDEILIRSACTTILLSVRKNGNVERAVRKRLSDSHKPDSYHPLTRLLMNKQLTAQPIEISLRELGAIGWWLCPKKETGDSGSEFPTPIDPILLTPTEIPTGEFLLHYTRRRVGPWPEQSRNEFLDDLIFSDCQKQRDELAALGRILTTRRLIGSNELTRDQRPVVCFSEIPVAELEAHRVFRPHLGRWDFEPYGIAIDRQYMQHLGAAKAIYANERDWEDLPSHQRPFFQIRTSSNQKIDWQVEQEWRIVGDVDLEKIPRDLAFVFVKNNSDVKSISRLCRWPIVVLSEKS